MAILRPCCRSRRRLRPGAGPGGGSRGAGAVLAAILLILTSGCATTHDPDPFESVNRKIFAFNETLDQYALEPAAKAWDFILPGFVQTGIDNFFSNLEMPIVFGNDVLQGKPMAAFEDILRLLFNSTFGLGGFIDIATMVEIPNHEEDFGQTLGVWGVPPGAFLVVPILGPYTLRDGFGDVVDAMAMSYGYMNPFWFNVVGLNTGETIGASVGHRATYLLNLRAIYLEEIAASRADAFDYYAFVRNAYLQNRQAKVLDQRDEIVIDADELYYFDDEDEDFDDFDESDPDEVSEESPGTPSASDRLETAEEEENADASQ